MFYASFNVCFPNEITTRGLEALARFLALLWQTLIVKGLQAQDCNWQFESAVITGYHQLTIMKFII